MTAERFGARWGAMLSIATPVGIVVPLGLQSVCPSRSPLGSTHGS